MPRSIVEVTAPTSWSDWAAQRYRLNLPHDVAPPPGVETFDEWATRSGATASERELIRPRRYDVSWANWAARRIRADLPYARGFEPPFVEPYAHAWIRAGGSLEDLRSFEPHKPAVLWDEWARPRLKEGLRVSWDVRPAHVETLEQFQLRTGPSQARSMSFLFSEGYLQKHNTPPGLYRTVFPPLLPGMDQQALLSQPPLRPHSELQAYLADRGLPFDTSGPSRFQSLSEITEKAGVRHTIPLPNPTDFDPPRRNDDAAMPRRAGSTIDGEVVRIEPKPLAAPAQPVPAASPPPSSIQTVAGTSTEIQSSGRFGPLQTLGTIASRLGKIGSAVRGGLPVLNAISTVIHAIREGQDLERATGADAMAPRASLDTPRFAAAGRGPSLT
jgi:hypothetical protein